MPNVACWRVDIKNVSQLVDGSRPSAKAVAHVVMNVPIVSQCQIFL